MAYSKHFFNDLSISFASAIVEEQSEEMEDTADREKTN
jgi:hypothetical protein